MTSPPVSHDNTGLQDLRAVGGVVAVLPSEYARDKDSAGPGQNQPPPNIPRRRIVIIQKAFRFYLAQQELLARKKAVVTRNRVVGELIATEQAYVHSLKLMMGMFMYPLKAAMGTPNEIISEKDFYSLFPNVELIVNLNSELLTALQERYARWSNQQKIGDIIFRRAPLFKMYFEYCKHYESAIAALRRLQSESPKFDKFLKTTNGMKEINEGLDLVSFLIKPVQRIPRYILLLEQLVKFTYPGHSDYDDLQKALGKVQDTMSHVNAAIGDAQRMNQLLDIEQKFGFTLNLMDPARKFIQEGQLGKVTSTTLVVRPFYFLFSDILVYGYENTLGGYKWKGTIQLGPAWVRDLKDTVKLKFAWQLVAEKKTYTLFASTQQEKDEWVTALSSAIDKLVSVNPELADRRSKKVQRTERSMIWNVFTAGAEADNQTDAQSVEREYTRQQEEVKLKAQSSHLIKIDPKIKPKDRGAVKIDPPLAKRASSAATPQDGRRDSSHSRPKVQFKEPEDDEVSLKFPPDTPRSDDLSQPLLAKHSINGLDEEERNQDCCYCTIL